MQDPAFIRRARSLGFSEGELISLRARVNMYDLSGGLGRKATGGWSDETSLLIGAHGVYSESARISHELGHVLSDIHTPGQFARASQMGYFGVLGEEMTAFGMQYGKYSIRGVWLSGMSASYAVYGLPGVVGYSALTSALGYYGVVRPLQPWINNLYVMVSGGETP